MKNWKNVEVPPRMQSLPKDHRGYPVPYVVLKTDNGTSHFQINETKIIEECIAGNYCSICGQPLETDMWFVGGPLSAFHPDGAYIDPPVHKECGKYALQVCPYLAAPNYGKRLDEKTLNEKNISGESFIDHTVIPDRPTFFVMAKTSAYVVRKYNPFTWYLIPIRPFLEIEYWKEGNQIAKEEAMKFLNI